MIQIYFRSALITEVGKRRIFMHQFVDKGGKLVADNLQLMRAIVLDIRRNIKLGVLQCKCRTIFLDGKITVRCVEESGSSLAQ